MPAEALAAAKKIDHLCEKKVGVGLVSMQIGQYAAMGEALGNMTALATKVSVHQTRGDSAADILSEKLEAYTAMRDVAEDLRAPRLKSTRRSWRPCSSAPRQLRKRAPRPIDSSRLPEALGTKDTSTTPSSPQDEQNDSLALLKRAGLHFIVVEDIV